MPTYCDLTLVDESEAKWANEGLELLGWVCFEHVVVLLGGGAVVFGARVYLAGCIGLVLLLALLEQLEGDRALQVNVTLHYVFFLKHLMDRSELLVSLYDCLGAILILLFERG